MSLEALVFAMGDLRAGEWRVLLDMDAREALAICFVFGLLDMRPFRTVCCERMLAEVISDEDWRSFHPEGEDAVAWLFRVLRDEGARLREEQRSVLTLFRNFGTCNIDDMLREARDPATSDVRLREIWGCVHQPYTDCETHGEANEIAARQVLVAIKNPPNADIDLLWR